MNSEYLKNGTAACSCWSKAVIGKMLSVFKDFNWTCLGIEEAKKEGCTSLTSETAKKS